jgi:phosphoribosylformylglycinamidine cyclo-ligase
MAHITGGGLYENIPRVLPEGLAAEIDAAAWPLPPVFRWLAGSGGVPDSELARTFNCGIGMMLVAAPGDAEALAALLTEAGEKVYRIGRVLPRPADMPGALVQGMAAAWHG